jgi:disulfide oxidoreductase YuzD
MDVIKWGKTRSIGNGIGDNTIININRKLYTQDDTEHVQELEYDDFIYSLATVKDDIDNSNIIIV